jgi:exodeoxyribonuclease-5
MDFDTLWIMGLTDTAWPPAAKPNPLLPAEAQRDAGSPNACATVQLDFARRILQRLLRSAPKLSISYPAQEQAIERRPSPLLRELGAPTPLPAIGMPWATETSGNRLEAIIDATAPPVPEGDKVSGGTWLLRAQAICPAWGFYQYRLGAKALAKPVEGLDPRKRGTLVHDTLECFWNNTRTLSALKAMTDHARSAAVADAANAALEKFNTDQTQEALKPQQNALEHRRLIRLVEAWLQLEITRPEDFTVLEAEGKRDVNIEGIVAHMRIDRIDQLTDGRTLIIDYKTGASVDTKNWAHDRITEPQLPIYAAIAEHADHEIAGVAFGVVHIADTAFRGIGQDDRLLPNVHGVESNKGRRLFDEARFPDWPSVLEHWRDAIHRVAREVREGDASIRITNDKDIRYCDVLPLLRMTERQQQIEAAERGDAPEGSHV